MIFFGLTGVAFLVYTIYGFFKKNPLDWATPTDATPDLSYDDESEGEIDDEWTSMSDNAKCVILDKQLHDYYQSDNGKALFTWGTF
jgi:hypothetical protein